MWRSHNLPKAIVYLLKGGYKVSNLGFRADNPSAIMGFRTEGCHDLAFDAGLTEENKVLCKLFGTDADIPFCSSLYY